MHVRRTVLNTFPSKKGGGERPDPWETLLLSAFIPARTLAPVEKPGQLLPTTASLPKWSTCSGTTDNLRNIIIGLRATIAGSTPYKPGFLTPNWFNFQLGDSNPH